MLYYRFERFLLLVALIVLVNGIWSVYQYWVSIRIEDPALQNRYKYQALTSFPTAGLLFWITTFI